jgi:hypothetical protein
MPGCVHGCSEAVDGYDVLDVTAGGVLARLQAVAIENL